MLKNLIVAFDKKGGISKNGMIPWRIKEDSNFFLDVTKRSYVPNKKNAVIIGKNTWKSLPKLDRGLKDRINIVVSKTMTNNELNSDNGTGADSYLVKSLNDGIELCNKLQPGKIFIGGGSNIYKEALENYHIDELYLTKINHDYECDNIFPLNNVVADYTEHSSKTFILNDVINDKKIEVEFIKLYKGLQPLHLKANKEEQQYLDLLETVLKTGDFRQTRNSMTWSKFACNHMEFDLSKGFPLLTTKRVFFRGAFEELLFFLKGDTNAKHLSDKGITIWDANTSRKFLDSIGLNHYNEYDLGNMYGFNWCHFGTEYKGMNEDYTNMGFNQINYCLELLKNDNKSRRIIMTTYDPANAHHGVLFPCHSIVNQWYVENDNRLSLTCYNRSQDLLLGNPFNVILGALLIHLFCEVLNNDMKYRGNRFVPGRLIMNFGDTHIYENHYSAVIRQILRDPFHFGQLNFKRKVTDLTDFKFEDLELIDYQCYPNIPAKMIA